MLILKPKDSDIISKYSLLQEYKDLLMTINALPGIDIITFNVNRDFDDIKYCYGKILIFFHVDKNKEQGLFLLANAINYENSEFWEIKLSTSGRIYDGSSLPISYILSLGIKEGVKENDILHEIKELHKQLNCLVNNKNFIDYYRIDVNELSLVDEVMFKRDMKLIKLFNDGINYL